MRIVLDTNVLLVALPAQSPFFPIFKAFLDYYQGRSVPERATFALSRSQLVARLPKFFSKKVCINKQNIYFCIIKKQKS